MFAMYGVDCRKKIEKRRKLLDMAVSTDISSDDIDKVVKQLEKNMGSDWSTKDLPKEIQALINRNKAVSNLQ